MDAQPVTDAADLEGALAALEALHARVDVEAARLTQLHGARLQCRRGCSDCCVDGLTVFAVEAERIRRAAPDVLRQEPHPAGACAFLDAEGACRVYAARPYVCRTQGLPLASFHVDAEDEVQEARAICEKNVEGAPLDALALEDCWLIGPTELELQRVQARASGGGQERVALRDLFARRRNGSDG